MPLSRRNLLLLLGAIVVAQATIGFLPVNPVSAAVTNFGQAILQAVAAGLMIRNAFRAEGQTRSFWGLMAAGVLLWLAGQTEWLYYEQFHGLEVPSPSTNDLFYFIHLVPMLAAVALRPHAPKEGDLRTLRFGHFDLLLLLLWWLFLYSYVLLPWQFVHFSADDFLPAYNFLYTCENAILIVALAIAWTQTKGGWRSVYRRTLIAASVYGASSLTANLLIYFHRYNSGSLIDTGLTASMCCFIYVAHRSEGPMEQEESGISARTQLQWHTALAFVALLSMPFFALWADFKSPDEGVEQFRMMVVFVGMVAMLVVFFFKQTQLDDRLMQLLQESQKAYEDQRQMQGHLVQAEKLAAIGRFVAGAAHEINNPLTAIVGYSDLLVNQESLEKEHKDFADKILQQARRTKTLVQNLLTFAKQTPLQRRAINMNGIVAHALQLHELDFAGKNVQIICRLHPELPHVVGDENQLLQVFLHIMNNAVDAMLDHASGGTLVISTDMEGDRVLWSCADTGPGVPDPAKIFDPFFTTKPVGKGTGLGLSASYGIIRDHNGQISCHNRQEGGAIFIVSLPAAPKGTPVGTVTPQPQSTRIQ